VLTHVRYRISGFESRAVSAKYQRTFIHCMKCLNMPTARPRLSISNT
jgi:hypothetical protein